MNQRFFAGGLIAGAAAGLIAALLQLALVQPLLLEAELYESGERVHVAAEGGHDHDHATVPPAAMPGVGGEAAPQDHAHDGAAGQSEGHDHGPPAFAIDPARDGLSVVFAMTVYAGWGLILSAAMAFAQSRGHEVGARQGLVWGLCGFLAVQLAPAAGLAPELPGMAAGELLPRQIWWAATVAATGLGLWLIAFGRGAAAWVAALALIALPHLVGAPHPQDYAGPVPPELAAAFAGRALGVGLLAWAALGFGCAWMRERDLAAAEAVPA